MRKFLRIIGILIISLFVLTGIGLAIFTNTVDPNIYKEKISRELSSALNHTVEIHGNLRWSFFPGLGVKVQNVQINNNDKSIKAALATIKEIEVNIKLWPLLQRRVEVRHVGLVGMSLTLVQADKNAQCWMAPALLLNGTSSEVEMSETKKSPININATSIGNISVQDARIECINTATQQKTVVEHLEFQSQNIVAGKQFPVTAVFDFHQNKPEFHAKKVVFYSRVTLDPTNDLFSFDKTKLTASLRTPEMPQDIDFKVETDITINNQQHTFNVASFLIKLANMQATGEISGSKMNTQATVIGRLQIDNVNFRQFMASVGKPLTMTDPTALQRMSVQFRFGTLQNYLKINPIQLKIDETTAVGSLVVNDISKKTATVDLTADKMQVGRYMTSSGKPSTFLLSGIRFRGNITPNKGREDFQYSKIDGEMAIARVQTESVQGTQVISGIHANNGVFILSPLAARLYEGGFLGNITLDVSGKVPSIAIKHSFTNIQLEPLLHDIQPLARIKISGIGNLDGNISLQGKTLEKMRSTLNGNLKFSIINGVWKGLDLSYWLGVGTALYHQEPPPAVSDTKETHFQSLTGTIVLTNGIAKNEDLLLKSSFIQATGKGTANLSSEQLDYRIDVAKINPATGQPRSDIIPILLTGSFSNLSIRPDLGALLKSQVKKQIQNQLEEHLGNDLGGKLNEQLKQLDLDKLLK